MGTSPKPTTWIGLGAIAIAALAAAYNLGKISAESNEQPQARQDAASKNDPDLRSTLSVTRKRLASCEKTLQRRDHHRQKREEHPHTNEDKRIPSPKPEFSEQCRIELQAIELERLAMNCRNFSGTFGAYKAILSSSTIDCEAVLSIRDLARDQYSECSDVIRSFEDASQPNVASDRRGIDAMESAYMFKSYYGDVDIDELVKNPACIDHMQAE
ncbi:hypothetical protein WME75_18205 [Sorangium sp. So ce1014]|uniref:hypothetical protein n=1 Tax=Sorangium sp. So ce1014 TaxID=3133326 RepID=UPI003F631F93